MTDKPSIPTPATMKEKLQTLFNDKSLRPKDAGTFLSHTHSEEGGRFAKPQQIVGAAPVPEYPRQPEGSFSNQAAVVPPEEPLGFSVDDVPIIGEHHEIEALLDAAVVAPEGNEPHHSHATVEQPAAQGDAAPIQTADKEAPMIERYLNDESLTEWEWKIEFCALARRRLERLENEKLSLFELYEEVNDAVLEAHCYFCGLNEDAQRRCAGGFARHAYARHEDQRTCAAMGKERIITSGD
jgi:hypothetical protein